MTKHNHQAQKTKTKDQRPKTARPNCLTHQQLESYSLGEPKQLCPFFLMDHLSQIIEQYGIYAVFALCTVEGDITLLISGTMAHSEFFGKYSFLKVLFFGTLGGMVGDSFGYMIGRIFHEQAKDYRFYQMA